MVGDKWILFINYNAYPCCVGGLEVFNYHLTKALSTKLNVHVLTFCNHHTNDTSIKTHIVKKTKFLKASLPLKTLKFLIKHRKDIHTIHVSYTKDFWSYFLPFYIIKKIFNISYMVTIHDGDLSDWKFKLPYKLFFKNANIVTGVSNKIVNAYENRVNGIRVEYTPPLVPFNLLKNKQELKDKFDVRNNEKVLLYVGSIKPLKSLGTLIDALFIMGIDRVKEFNLKVLIAGDGILKNELEQKVLKSEFKDFIKFLGNVPSENINELYCLANYYIICSRYEGLPIATLEAFANKLPCLTSDAPGLLDISNNNKNTLLFKVGDANDCAEKISTVLSNDKLATQLAENGHNYYNSLFSYPKLVDEFKNMIQSINA